MSLKVTVYLASYMDLHESETVIRNSLKSLSHKLTIISVTHRASMVKHSDMIYVFDKGSIVARPNQFNGLLAISAVPLPSFTCSLIK